MKTTGKGKQILMAVVTTIFIFSASVALALNFRPLYYRDMQALKIPETSGYSAEVIRRNYDILIDYNDIGGPDRLEFPDFIMSATGRIHFAQVKVIFLALQWTAVVTLPCVIFGVLYFRRRRQSDWLKYTALASLLIPAVLGLLLAADWNRFFIAFHELVFRNNYWIFSPTEDPIINILPDEFFEHCAILILLNIAAGSLVCAVSRRRALKRPGTAAAAQTETEGRE